MGLQELELEPIWNETIDIEMGCNLEQNIVYIFGVSKVIVSDNGKGNRNQTHYNFKMYLEKVQNLCMST